MFETIAAIFAAGIVAQVVFWTVVGLLFPAFWLWMIIDAALRAEQDFPSGGVNEKIIWIVVLFFIQLAAIPYFFFVYRAAPNARPVRPVPPTVTTA